MRGTLHLLTPEEGGAFLSLLADGRSWERPSWQREFGVMPGDMGELRLAVREALVGRPLSRDELVAAVVARPRLAHLAPALRSGWGTVLKPLAWHGELCFGPSQGSRVTFVRPEAASPRWAGIPEPDQAAPRAISAYLAAYGPSTPGRFSNWLSRGRTPQQRLRGWFGDLRGRLAEVTLDGESAWVLAEHLDELVSTRPSTVLRFLPGFDPWVLGPGTEDHQVVPSGRRAAVSRQSGWISPVVVAGGLVCATWGLDGDTVQVEWFRESSRPPGSMLDGEVARLSEVVGRDLRASVRLV